MTGIETLLLLAGLAVVMALAYAGPRVPAVLTGSQPADVSSRYQA